MADSDEENPRSSPSFSSTTTTTTSNPSNTTHMDADHEPDLSEETQDFRLLASLTSTSTSLTSLPSSSSVGGGGPSLPRRGEKDFEPNPTKAQEQTLRASRKAMHDALSVERVHGTKGWVVGYLVGRVGGGHQGKEKEKEKEKDGTRWEKCVVRVDAPRGQHFRTMGVSDGRNRIWLLPEEALYLVERGSLDARWGVPDREEGGEGEDEAPEDADGGGDPPPALSDMPMSLQGAYATFISENDLTLTKYTVFAGLRRSGYTVIRAPTWDGNIPPSNASQQIPRQTENKKVVSSIASSRSSSWFNWPRLRDFITRIFRVIFRLSPSMTYHRHRNSCPSLGPLVAPGLYRSYTDIYRALTLIPFHDPLSSRPSPPAPPSEPTTTTEARPSQKPSTAPTSTIPPFRIHYHVYKPNTPYRKTAPPPPDFHVAVIDARAHPHLPTLTEIGTLLEEMPIVDPKEDDKLKKGRPEMRLKAGTRSVVLAVVDSGVVSFLRVAETGSGRERIFEGKAGRRGVSKGGRRGGRGGRGSGGRGRGAG